MPPRLCILGSINMDLVVRSPRLPAPGETLLGGPFETHPGGKGANQAVAAARLGAEVSFIGAVGDDEHGRALRAVLDRGGIDTSRVLTRPDAPTGVALITVSEPTGENTIIVSPGANATLSTAEIDAARPAIAAADVLLMQLETPVEAVTRAAGLARDAGTTVILNAAPAVTLPPSLAAAVDVLIVNETEAAAVVSPSSPNGGGGRVFAAGGGFTSTTSYSASSLRNPARSQSRTAEPTGLETPEPLPDLSPLLLRLQALGPTTTILTAGSRGALFSFGSEPPGHIPAFPIQPIDTVGAGDAFCGVLAARLAEHQIGDGGGRAGGIDRMAVVDAVCWACAAGALACTKRGAIPSLPTRAEVISLLRSRD